MLNEHPTKTNWQARILYIVVQGLTYRSWNLYSEQAKIEIGITQY